MGNNNLAIGTILSKCIPFLNSIGIATIFRKIETACFLPGLLIENGNIIIDRDALLYPGDILHEAGHIAVVPASERTLLNNQSVLDSKNRETEEMMAIAWSYAACMHLELDPLIVFHEKGYNGRGETIVEDFNAGDFLGAPSLQWCKMTIEPGNAKQGDAVYPVMKKWLRD
jgi:hypothetical protein